MSAVLMCNREFLDFRNLEVLTVDESKPWKPPKTVIVTLANDEVATPDANMPFFMFVTDDGNLTVSAAAAGHVQKLHFENADPGSQFGFPSLYELFRTITEKLPDGIAKIPGRHSFGLEMGRPMGYEGIASLQELMSVDVVSSEDIATITSLQDDVFALNKRGDIEAKRAFVAEKGRTRTITFALVRNTVLVPTVIAPMRPTTKLCLSFGPQEGSPNKTLYMAAPGRWMPRHPDPKQFSIEEGGVDGEAFQESLESWLTTAMLTQK